MEARARSLEGSLTIEPREPVGTRHLLRMPRSEKEGSG
jgi:hypothetical protein